MYPFMYSIQKIGALKIYIEFVFETQCMIWLGVKVFKLILCFYYYHLTNKKVVGKVQM